MATDSAGFCVEAGRAEGAGTLGADSARARSASLSDGPMVAAAVCWDSVVGGALGSVAARDAEEADKLDGGMALGSLRGAAPDGGSIRRGPGTRGGVGGAGCGGRWP